MRPWSKHLGLIPRRFVTGVVLSLGLVTSGSAGTIAPDLAALMASTTSSRRPFPVIMRMASQANLAPISSTTWNSRAERVRAVVTLLENHAASTQADLSAWLWGYADLRTRSRILRTLRSFWIENIIYVEVPAPVIQECAARADVEVIMSAGRMTKPAGLPSFELPQWNVTRVRAPEVWARGILGAGTLVASIDGGVTAEHPALEGNVLRNAAGDPIVLDTVDDRTFLRDETGHGTHTMGVAVGSDGIGVAPEAKWISCKAFKRRRGQLQALPANILRCAQWILNPDAPNDPDPAHVADVVLNPWWLAEEQPGTCIPRFQQAVRAWRAADMLPVFAVGDAVGTASANLVPSPANYPEVFSVGSTDSIDEIVSTSFRGTADCGGPARPAPRVVAPGLDITSADRFPGSFTEQSGTDAAAAHAAGVALLVRSAYPTITVDQLDSVLQRSAKDAMPGPVYRPGLLDAVAAIDFEDAHFISQVAPTGTQTTNTPFAATVKMKNVGVAPWTQGVHRLTAINPHAPTWGVEFVDLPVAQVLPGAEVAFTFNILMPSVPNVAPGYVFQWQMSRNGTLFGNESTPVNVLVRGFNGANWRAPQIAPPRVEPGQCVPVSVSFENTGTNPWTRAAGYRLASENPPDNTTWGLNRVDLAQGETIPSGGVKNFAFTACSPQVQGEYPFQWRMVQEGVERFGAPSAPIPVTVTGNDDSEVCGVSGLLPELRVGQPADVTICMRNRGSNAWINGYCLKAVPNSFQPADFWGPTVVCLGAGEQILSQQTRNFTFRITARDEPGRWDFGYQMVRPSALAFGQALATTIGIPRDFQASADFAQTQGNRGWVFRHQTDTGTWAKMTFATDHWQGPATIQKIFPTTAHPGTNRVARFWKSPVAARVRINVGVRDLDPSCGDGVNFKIRVRKGEGQSFLREEVVVTNADPQTHSFSFEEEVSVNDTVRFILGSRSSTGCDTTLLDPLIQVLPPGTVGPAPIPQSIFDPLVEPD